VLHLWVNVLHSIKRYREVSLFKLFMKALLLKILNLAQVYFQISKRCCGF
jgi:hypothetical protein